MILIILRDSEGSGKSKVYEGLKDKISIDSCFLNLDQTRPTTHLKVI